VVDHRLPKPTQVFRPLDAILDGDLRSIHQLLAEQDEESELEAFVEDLTD
jgi:hypothetical protein